MSEVDANSVGLRAGIQPAKGSDATVWQTLQPSAFGKFGAETKSVTPTIISTDRQRARGSIVGRSSALDYDGYLTREWLQFWAAPMLLTTRKGPAIFRPTEVRGDSYLVASGGALAAGTLIYVSGATNARNNGLKKLAAGSTATRLIDAASSDAVKAESGPIGGEDYDAVLQARFPGVAGNLITWTLTGDGTATVRVSQIGNAVTILYETGVSTVGDVNAAIAAYAVANPLTALLEVKTAGTAATVLTAAADDITIQTLADGEDSVAGLTPETPDATKIRIEVCGFEFATGDAEIDADGNFITTTKDLTSLLLNKGQFVFVGGELESDNVFAEAANWQLARIADTPAVGKLTLDNKTTTFVEDDGAGQEIRLFFGSFWMVVAVTHADYLKQYVQGERTLPDLDEGDDVYQYPKDNVPNEWEAAFATEALATIKMACVGTNTPRATTSRKAGASTAYRSILNKPINTFTDGMRLRIAGLDEAGLTTDIESMTIKGKNNVSAKGVLFPTNGANSKKVIVGEAAFDVDLKAILMEPDLLDAIDDDTECSLVAAMRNDDGGMVFDFPAGTISGGGLETPANDAVLVPLTFAAHQSTAFDSSLMVSAFPSVPAPAPVD